MQAAVEAYPEDARERCGGSPLCAKHRTSASHRMKATLNLKSLKLTQALNSRNRNAKARVSMVCSHSQSNHFELKTPGDTSGNEHFCRVFAS